MKQFIYLCDKVDFSTSSAFQWSVVKRLIWDLISWLTCLQYTAFLTMGSVLVLFLASLLVVFVVIVSCSWQI